MPEIISSDLPFLSLSPRSQFSKLSCKNNNNVPSGCHNYVTKYGNRSSVTNRKDVRAESPSPVPPDGDGEKFPGALTWAPKSGVKEETRLGRKRFRRLRPSYERTNCLRRDYVSRVVENHSRDSSLIIAVRRQTHENAI